MVISAKSVLGLAIAGFAAVGLAAEAEKPDGMVWIPGGEFSMGSRAVCVTKDLQFI